MDKITKNYRRGQFDKVNNGNYKYKPTIKIYGAVEGNTHCMDISKEEFDIIHKILVKSIF